MTQPVAAPDRACSSAHPQICDPADGIDGCATLARGLPYLHASLQPATVVNRVFLSGGLPMPSSARREEVSDEIRAVPLERLIDAPVRVLPFVPRIELSLDERMRRLRTVDPRSAEMLMTAFDRLYALRFPDDAA